MTQFSETVEQQRLKLKAEEWYKQVKQIYAHDKYVDTYYNSGEIKRFNCDTKRYSVIEKAKPLEEVIHIFEGYIADIKNKGLKNIYGD